MDEQHADFLDGLSVVENELERVIGELDEMYSRLGIHVLEVVSLWPLQWALNKLADDLHDADSELRNARLEVASAQREASEARQKQQAEQLQSLSVFNGLRHELETVKAERDSLKQENDWLRQSKDAAVIEMDAARQQAEEMQGRHELQSVYSAGQAGRIAGLEGVVESLTAERDRLREQVAELTKKIAGLSRDTIARLSGNSGELPAETAPESADLAPEWHRWNHDTKLFHQRHPDVTRGLHDATAEDMERMYCNGWRELPEPAPEPYQWQVGDELVGEDGTIHTITQAMGGLLWFKNETLGASAQWWLTENGYRLHRKALPRLKPRHVPLDDLPDIEPMTPQQVAEIAAVTEPIDDDDEQEEEIVTLAEWALVTSEPECSEWLPGRWDGESDGIGHVTMFRTGSTTERYVYNARIPVRDLRAAGINLGQWLRFREVLVCGESGKQEYRFEIRQCDQPISDSTGADGEGQS